MKKKNNLFLLLFLLVITGVFARQGSAQWTSGAVFDCPQNKYMLTIGGLYSEFEWQEEYIRSFEYQARVQAGFSPFKFVQVTGSAAYSLLDLRREGLPNIKFKPDYAWGFGLHLGPFYLVPQKLAVAPLFVYDWFNPYGEIERNRLIGRTEVVEKDEFILERWRMAGGFSLIVRTRQFDFYAGPMMNSKEYRIRYRHLVQGNDSSLIDENRRIAASSGMRIGFFGGVSLKLPGRYYLSLEVRNDDLKDTIGIISFGQSGPP